MAYEAAFEAWKTDTFFDADTRKELSALEDAKEIEDRFYRDLEFGTGGLRGIMGAGTNRMNKYTVGKVTMGLGKYLLAQYGDLCKTRGVAIGYDTRNNSKAFADVSACVLSAMGIRAICMSTPCPTPQLSFSVKYTQALAGIVITASHNPREYNGYKVYDEHGCQLVPWQANQISQSIAEVKDFHVIPFDGNKELIETLDTTDAFCQAVLKQSRLNSKQAKEALHIVYTPLHGTGRVPMLQTLELDGFTCVDTVPEQMAPDGNFPTVVSPNPEDRKALSLGISQAEKCVADIVLGTDPDSDRVGVAIRTKEKEYRLMTGNQIGALLTDFVLQNDESTHDAKHCVINTIVTSDLGAEIARRNGLSVFSTLTGFKFIGEKITQFEMAKQAGKPTQDYEFLMGYEESYGYLVGTHARDKDAIVAGLLICEMAAQYKAQGKTLEDRIEELYTEYGYYRDALDSFTLKGKDGLEQIQGLMTMFREKGSPIKGTQRVIDFSKPTEAEPGFGMLPASDVVKFILEDGSWIAVRPSGTEPKIKIYYSIKGETQAEAARRFQAIQSEMLQVIDIES